MTAFLLLLLVVLLCPLIVGNLDVGARMLCRELLGMALGRTTSCGVQVRDTNNGQVEEYLRMMMSRRVGEGCRCSRKKEEEV